MRVALLTSAVALVLGGCGDDEGGRVEQDTAGTGTTPASVPEATAPATARTTPEREATVTVPEGDLTTPRSPEDSAGGAGDEEGARSQALFTGRGGSVRPRLVQVPPFIAIRVVLRSGDGRAYRLRFGRRSISVGGRTRSASATFDGLRPGKRLVAGGREWVAVEASAEPGP